MFEWLRKLFASAQARAALLDKLEQQAGAAKEELNASLRWALTSSNPEIKVAHLELAKAKFAELQAIAAEHPKMRLTNEEEVETAIQRMAQEFTRAGYYAVADARRRQAVSAHVSLSPKAKSLLR